jgi:hypothetical protein
VFYGSLTSSPLPLSIKANIQCNAFDAALVAQEPAKFNPQNDLRVYWASAQSSSLANSSSMVSSGNTKTSLFAT